MPYGECKTFPSLKMSSSLTVFSGVQSIPYGECETFPSLKMLSSWGV
jgi:hypothetical protein